MSDQLIKIGRLSELSGLSERTIRYYEKLGIIAPRRSDGGTRWYHENDVEVAKLAQRMRDLHIPVERIRTIAVTRKDYNTGDESSSAMIELLEAMLDELGEQASKTLALQSEMVKTLRLIRQCQGCKNYPDSESCPECPMGNSPDRTSFARMIWQ